MAKLVWRVKLVTELRAGETTEVEVARIERDDQAGLSDLGLHLARLSSLPLPSGGDRPGTGDDCRKASAETSREAQDLVKTRDLGHLDICPQLVGLHIC